MSKTRDKFIRKITNKIMLKRLWNEQRGKNWAVEAVEHAEKITDGKLWGVGISELNQDLLDNIHTQALVTKGINAVPATTMAYETAKAADQS